MKSTSVTPSVAVRFDATVLQSIRRHARTSMDAEICGVLVGSQTDGRTVVDGSIAGEQAAQGAAHVTFTQNTWEHIYRVKDRDYPEKKVVGWYHSHPGFGVFLSEHDAFIHKNFFSAPHQVACVVDPHSDEEGCFGWANGQLRRIGRFEVVTAVLETGPRPEPKHALHVEPAPPTAKAEPIHARIGKFWRRLSVRHKCLILFTAVAVLAILNVFLLMRLFDRCPSFAKISKTEIVKSVRRVMRRPMKNVGKEPVMKQATETDATAQLNGEPNRPGRSPETPNENPTQLSPASNGSGASEQHGRAEDHDNLQVGDGTASEGGRMK